MAAPSSIADEDALLKLVLSQRRSLFFSERTHLPEAECQRLWERAFAQFTPNTSPQPSSTQSPRDTDLNAFTEQQETVSRTESVPMKKRRLGDGTSQSTHSAHSSIGGGQSMLRKRSSLSNNSPQPTIDTSIQNPSGPVNTWLGSEPPYTAFDTVESPRLHTAPRSRRHSRPLLVTSLDPGTYCKQLPDQSPTNLAGSFGSSRPIWLHHRNPSSNVSSSPFSDSLTSPVDYKTPFSDSLASPVDYKTDPTSAAMSRQTSKASTSFCTNLKNMRLAPNMSRSASNISQSYNNSPVNMECTKHLGPESALPLAFPSASFDSHQVLSYTGGAADEKKLSEAFQSQPLDLINEVDVKMDCTISTESHILDTSRLSRRSREQVASASRPLVPALKESPEPPTSASMSVQCSLPTSHSMSRTPSSGSQNPQMQIPRIASYERRVQAKIKCDECNKKPEGYRGEHELRRHKKSAHGKKRKVWVCIDASPGQTYLAACEHCKGFKRYNAYYNAAAHLRRKHFNAKPKGEKKKGKLSPEERRGGKGGGTEPSMDILKNWMHEMDVHSNGEPIHPDDLVYSRRRLERASQDLKEEEYAPEFDAEDDDLATEPYADVYHPTQQNFADHNQTQSTTWNESPLVSGRSSPPSPVPLATSVMPSQDSSASFHDTSGVSPEDDYSLFNMSQYSSDFDFNFEDVMFASSQS